MDKALQFLMVKSRAFWRARKANVAMMFGIALVPIMVAAGAGLDMARGMMARSAMSEALDAAALAVGSTPNVTQDQAQTIAQKYFNANYHGDPSYGSTPTLGTPVITGQSVTLSVSQDVATSLLAVGGIPHLHISAASTVVWGQTRLWVTLVLDNTGSMTQEDSTHTTKISALKTASHQLLTMLQGASTNVGDVQAAIVPFSRTVNVGTGSVNANWIDWADWESKPAHVTLDNGTADNNGPGAACPFTDSNNHQMSPYGFNCVSSATNGASSRSTIPSSGSAKGLICPGVDSGTYNSGRVSRYYNGCYNSTPTQTNVHTVATPSTLSSVAACKSNSTGTCTGSVTTTTSTSTGSATTTDVTVAGYSGDSTANTSSTGNPTVGSPVITHTGSGANKVYTTKVTTTTVTTNNVITRTGLGPWTHAWVVNDHSTWGGCLMDRAQNYDTTADAPTVAFGSLFPAENEQSCVPSVVTPLPSTWTASQWTTLSTNIDAMSANGSTNQTIGLQHGMMTQTSGASPYGAPDVPANTTRYIILVSDGLNTQNRWNGDGTNQSTQVDARMAAACTNAKAAGFIIYTIFVDLGGTQGNSVVLQNCASDSSKYFDLTSSGAIVTAFNTIGQQITALRVSQ